MKVYEIYINDPREEPVWIASAYPIIKTVEDKNVHLSEVATKANDLAVDLIINYPSVKEVMELIGRFGGLRGDAEYYKYIENDNEKYEKTMGKATDVFVQISKKLKGD